MYATKLSAAVAVQAPKTEEVKNTTGSPGLLYASPIVPKAPPTETCFGQLHARRMRHNIYLQWPPPCTLVMLNDGTKTGKLMMSH